MAVHAQGFDFSDFLVTVNVLKERAVGLVVELRHLFPVSEGSLGQWLGDSEISLLCLVSHCVIIDGWGEDGMEDGGWMEKNVGIRC